MHSDKLRGDWISGPLSYSCEHLLRHCEVPFLDLLTAFAITLLVITIRNLHGGLKLMFILLSRQTQVD